MRHTALIALAACGAAFAFSPATPARAQEAPSAPPAVLAPLPAPPVTTTAAPPDQPLAIPAPPGLTVQVEMDLHDDDLLGVFKSLLRGVSQAAEGAKNATESKPAAGRTARDADIAAILSNADLSDVLKDVTHIHFVLYGPPAAPASPARAAGKPGGAPRAVAPLPSLPADPTALYENAFASEGGRRIIFVNSDPIHVVMTTFGKGRGFAFTVHSPDSVGVLRANGYPDLSKLAALATSVGAVAGKSVLDEATKPGAPKQ